jgi:hypothetical protein
VYERVYECFTWKGKKPFVFMVGAAGFELATLSSQSIRSLNDFKHLAVRMAQKMPFGRKGLGFGGTKNDCSDTRSEQWGLA